MAEESTQLRHARPQGPRSNWVPIGVVVAVIAVLTGGSALVNAGLPPTDELPSGRTMTLGSGEGHKAAVTFDDGWELDTGSSTQGQQYLFSKGPVNLLVLVVTPPEKATAAELWEGMRDIVRVGDASATLGDPEPVTSDGGAQGLTGDLYFSRRTGTASVFTSPGGDFAVEAQAYGADADQTDLSDAEALVRSLRFDRSPGDDS